MTTKSQILLSIVIPFRNRAQDAAAVIREVSDQVAPLVSDYEIVIVDNGSGDEQFAEYAAILGPDGLSNVQVYRLMQKVDDEVAAWAGVENSLGDYVLVYYPLTEDLSRLEDALDAISRGCEVVYLRNTVTTDVGFLEKLLGPMFRWFFRFLTGIDLSHEATPGRIISKRVVSYLLQQPRPTVRYRALPSVSGFSKVTLDYAAPRSTEGRRTFWERVRAAVDLVVSNSIAPLRIASMAALFGGMGNLGYSVYVVLIAFLKRDVAPGWTTLSLQQSGMFFLLSVMMLVLTEYLIQMIRWNSSGPSYFLASEVTSAVLTRRQKLNVEQAGSDWRDSRQHLDA
jgi:hypothetical protein